jgi:hypothetical protein
MSEELKFKCEECGKEFEPDPDSMVEMHLSATMLSIDEETPHGAIDAEELNAMSKDDLKENGLTEEDRQKLLAGEELTIGGCCICKECQDFMSEEQS